MASASVDSGVDTENESESNESNSWMGSTPDVQDSSNFSSASLTSQPGGNTAESQRDTDKDAGRSNETNEDVDSMFVARPSISSETNNLFHSEDAQMMNDDRTVEKNGVRPKVWNQQSSVISGSWNSSDDTRNFSAPPEFNFHLFSTCRSPPLLGFPNLSYDATYEDQREPQRKIRLARRRSLRPILTWSRIKGAIADRKLRIAANVNNLELMESLLANGANPQKCDEHKRTALHFAACKGYTEAVRLLLQNGANPNQTDSIGNTPLHLAACTNHIDVVTLLLKAGTDVRLVDNYGRSPLQLAQGKLRLLKMEKSIDSVNLKTEVHRVIEMLQAYLEKKGQEEEAELLKCFNSRLSFRQTAEEVSSDVDNLLASLSNLNLRIETKTSEISGACNS